MLKFISLIAILLSPVARADAPVIWSGTTAKWLPNGLHSAGICKMAADGTQTNYTTNGIVKMSSGVPGAAVSGTDFAPATSGSAILKGNGSGGFSSAVSGTDYAPATSGSAILKGNGSGGFSSAVSGTDYQAPISTSASVTHQFLTAWTAPNTYSRAQPDFTDLSGSAAASQMPALTGDVTTSAGAVATTVAKIQGTTVSGTTGSGNVVFSSAPTLNSPVVGTQSAGDNSTKAASTAYADNAASSATAFLKLAGRSGGQSAAGGTGASENLTLQSTTNGTVGSVIIANQDE
jgi:hypothetical protein